MVCWHFLMALSGSPENSFGSHHPSRSDSYEMGSNSSTSSSNTPCKFYQVSSAYITIPKLNSMNILGPEPEQQNCPWNCLASSPIEYFLLISFNYNLITCK
jgi:hypothetical protein